MKFGPDLYYKWCSVLIVLTSLSLEVGGRDEDRDRINNNLQIMLSEYAYGSNLQIPVRAKTTAGPRPGGDFNIHPQHLPTYYPPANWPNPQAHAPESDEGNATIKSSEKRPSENDAQIPSDGGGASAASSSFGGVNGGYEPDILAYPVNVEMNVQVQSVREIDELNEKIIVELDLTLHWKDYKLFPKNDSYDPEPFENITDLLLTHDSGRLPLDDFAQIWKPDIIVERVVKITRPELLSIPITVRGIPHTSSVIYTSRVSIKVDCTMNFEYYPADSQHCNLNLRSYQNDNSKMNLRWNPLPGAYLITTDSDDNFDVQLSKVESRKKRVKDINLDDAIFNVLQIKISMRRKMTYHLVQTYIPSAFLVFITWLSFLVPEELIEARIGISMTTLLTLTAMFSAVRENTPIVSYVKAIDVWMLYCVIIVFSTLLEFIFFVWLRDYKKSQREKSLMRMMDSDATRTPKPAPNIHSRNPDAPQRYSIEVVTSKAIQSFEKTSTLFNRFAFFLFVLIFMVFNLVYWPWLLVSSEHFKWEVNSTLNGVSDEEEDFIMDEL